MSTAPLVPGPVYGLRTWAIAGAPGAERLVGPQRGEPWPPGAGWLTASCPAGHRAPAAGCGCGAHAYHPRPQSAARVLRGRFDVAGVIEATGAIELHREGLRAERARPVALLLAPRGNRARLERLAAAYGAELVPVRRPADVLAWCAERGYGLAPAVVDDLLGPEVVAQDLAERRHARRRSRVRVAAALAVTGALLGAGLAATDDPGDRPLYGRMGAFHQR